MSLKLRRRLPEDWRTTNCPVCGGTLNFAERIFSFRSLRGWDGSTLQVDRDFEDSEEDRRSLALHDAVAAKLEAQPELLDVARANLQRWLRLNPAPALHEWAHLLDSLSVPALVGLLRSGDERATRLRQSSPFAGFLTAQERQAILNDYESRRT